MTSFPAALNPLHRLALFAAFVCFFAAVPPGLRAQSVRWEPGAGTLAFGQTSDLALIFDQCEPEGAVALPETPGLVFSQPPSRTQQASYNVVNFKTTASKTVTLTYTTRVTEHRPLQIPAFDVQTDKGKLHVPAASFEVGDATVGQSGLSLETVAQSRFNLPPGQIWAGEVFPLSYTLNVLRRYYYQLGSHLEWTPAPFTIEEWDKPELFENAVNGEARVTIVYKTRAYAKSPGTLELRPGTQLVNITTGESAFGLFARPNLQQFAVSTKPASLVVRPLPVPAPAGFTGAVGQFTLDSKVVPATATVGEPITWTLELSGAGNWPDIAGLPSRSVSKDFRVVQPQAKRTNKEGMLFEASLVEDIVLIPTKPGSYTLGPVNFVTFDPKTGLYKTVSTEPVTVTVAAPAAAGLSAPPATAPSAAGATPAGGERPPLIAERPATPPAAIPRDPLPPSAPAFTPWTNRTVLAGAVSAVSCPLLVWLVLALRRARVTDPRRPQREARRRILATLQALRTADASSAPARRRLLLQWQHDTAVLWQLSQATPSAASFAPESPAPGAEAWSALWRESENALYGAAGALPADWIARAEQAATTRRVPAFSVFQLFLRRNLLPLVLLGLTLVFAASAAAADGRAAYAQADFPAAEKAWRDAVQTGPTDWVARHNLALALAQQNRWPEAAGHALAAFVQNPSNPSVRWHLDLALAGARVAPAELTPLLAGTPAAALVRRASPACWQVVAFAAAWLAAAALGLLVWRAYHRQAGWARPLAYVALTLAIGLGLASAWSLRLYGPLKDVRAVLVIKPGTLRSIPTEVEKSQKSSPLSPGLIALSDKTFLGWQRLTFANGQTGWVRTEDFVPLWK